jgi:radial spoke head protein 9
VESLDFQNTPFQKPTFVPDDQEVFVTSPQEFTLIKEEDRLACIVHLIATESATVPRGSLYLQHNQCVTVNPFFRGLTASEASQLKNFQLLRNPINNRMENLTKRENFNYLTDFFDTIDDVFPGRCFTIRTNDREICMIRSLKWPGMVFCHKLNTPHQGFCYFGNGRENLDLMFMIN